MPNRAAIKDWARTQTMIETDDLSDARLENIINQGIRDMATRFDWPFLATDAEESITAGVDLYAMPSDLSKLAALTLNDTPYRLVESSPTTLWMEEGGMPASGTPTRFALWGSQIMLRPVPAADGVLTIHYYRFPSDLVNDADEPEWADQFHMVVADFAIGQIWEREEEFDKAKASGERYLNGIELMARFYLNRAGDSPLTIGQVPTRRTPGQVAAQWV